MSNKKNSPRFQHVGKTQTERAAYQEFLKQYQSLDKTASEFPSLETTDKSSFDDKKKSIPNIKITPTSWKLKIWDFFRTNLSLAVITAVVVMAVTGYVVLASKVGSQDVKIENLSDDIKKLTEKSEEVSSLGNALNTSFQVFKAEVAKDIEYIRENLNSSQ